MVSRAELQAFVDGTVDERLWPGIRLLLVGVNPGLWTAAVNAPFARPGNRFWPALHRAGILDHTVDASDGLSDADTASLRDSGVGITNLVNRATARADELGTAELRAGRAHVADVVERYRPAVVAVLGITAYRVAFDDRKAGVGRQPVGIGNAELWVVPNPSGLNAHETVDSLARAYAEVARAAGLDVASIDDG